MSTATTHSLDDLVEKVRDLMDTQDVSFRAAVVGVHSEIGENGDLRAFWQEVGDELLAKALQPHFRKRGPTGPQIRSGGAVVRQGTSWRERMRQDPDSLLDLELPVGSTGEIKAVGDFTRADVAAVEEFYSSRISVLRTRKEYWTRVRKRMRPGDTIRKLYEEGRIRETDLTFTDRSLRDMGRGLVEGEGGVDE